MTITVPMMAAVASRGVTARPAAAPAPAGAVAVVAAVATAPVGATVMAAVGVTPVDSVATRAASAAGIFLLWLPGGRPLLRDTGGVAAGSFA
jgi:hypothetical protein